MSLQPTFPGLFSHAHGAKLVAQKVEPHNPATEKQLSYARLLAARAGVPLPRDVVADRAKLSAWIDRQIAIAPAGRFSDYPSSKQVAFAERIARLKRRPVPPECFRDRTLMARWIDSNKPR